LRRLRKLVCAAALVAALAGVMHDEHGEPARALVLPESPARAQFRFFG
jgi:hypothetical protein